MGRSERAKSVVKKQQIKTLRKHITQKVLDKKFIELMEQPYTFEKLEDNPNER